MSLNPAGQSTSASFAPTEILKNDKNLYIEPLASSASYTIDAGDVVGIATASPKLITPLKKSDVATAVADTTLVTTVTVLDASGFLAGDTIDIVDGTDNSTELFSDLVISSISGNVITVSAALGAGALDLTDWVRLKTVDGCEVAKGIALDGNNGEARVVRVAIRGNLVESKLSANINTYNVKTELNASSEVAGALVLG